MIFDTAICGGILLSSHNGYLPVIGSVGVKDGRIAYAGDKKITKSEAGEYIDAYGKVIMPGLVNGHCHGDMAIGKGLGDGLTLQEQMDLFKGTNWFYELINEEDRYYSRMLTYIEAILSGTTFIIENMYWGLGSRSNEAMAMVGIKGGLVEDIRADFSNPDKNISAQSLSDFGVACKKYGQIPLIGNISEEDFNENRLKNNKKMIDRFGYYETRHLAETTWRVKMVQDQYGTTPVNYLDKCEVLHPKMIGSHAIYISEDEIKVMAEKGVKVVNTPLCEMKIADGIAPIPSFLKYGVTVGLGTDGAMWNNSNDIFREMKGIALLHSMHTGPKSISIKNVLNMATIDGAKVFGLDKEMGTLEVDKTADIILINVNQAHMAPIRIKNRENVSSSIVYCATGNDVTDVFINGKHMVKNKILATVNIEEIIEKVNIASEKVARNYLI